MVGTIERPEAEAPARMPDIIRRNDANGGCRQARKRSLLSQRGSLGQTLGDFYEYCAGGLRYLCDRIQSRTIATSGRFRLGSGVISI